MKIGPILQGYHFHADLHMLQKGTKRRVTLFTPKFAT